MIALILLCSFMFLLLLGVPVAFAMGISALLIIWLTGGQGIIIPHMLSVGVQSFPLMAVPFFILAGNIMNITGVTKRIYGFALSVAGHFKGGLGHVNVLASMIFSGISGSAAADAAGLGSIQIKRMVEEGYSKRFSAAITAASSILGPIIPPSIIMVIYAVEANVSISKMFVAGIGPGLVIGISLMAMVYYLAATGKEACPTRPRATLKEIAKATKDGFLAIIAPVIIMLGMVSGIVTPTEAGVLAIVYSIVVGLIYGDIEYDKVLGMIKESAISTAQVMFLFASATLFSWVMTNTRVPITISEHLLGFTDNKYVMLLIINVVLLIIGSFMEAIAAMILFLPIVMPIVHHLGIDPIHFGIIVCFNLMLGLLHPPLGSSLFIVSSITDIKYEEVVKGVWPFLLILVVSLLAVTFVPEFSLWLPSYMK